MGKSEDGRFIDRKRLIVTVFRDKRREWRWHLSSPNGRIIATSGGDGYKRQRSCLRSLDVVQEGIPMAPIEILNFDPRKS